jgi:hypothetical protein
MGVQAYSLFPCAQSLLVIIMLFVIKWLYMQAYTSSRVPCYMALDQTPCQELVQSNSTQSMQAKLFANFAARS